MAPQNTFFIKVTLISDQEFFSYCAGTKGDGQTDRTVNNTLLRRFAGAQDENSAKFDVG